MCLGCYGGLVHINGSVRVQAALGLARGHRCCVCPYCNYGLDQTVRQRNSGASGPVLERERDREI